MSSPPSTGFIYQPPECEIPILHVDDHYLIVDKPAGLLSVPGRGAAHQDCLIARLQATWPEALIVHRLDMDTSGLMIIARGVEAHRALSMMFERREPRKEYHAFVYGHPREDDGVITLPLRADIDNRPRQIVDHEHGKPCETHWRVVTRFDNGTAHILLKPVTGRSHQLRVHMAQLGHPILGDNLYAHEAALAMGKRLYLHASALAFNEPWEGGSCVSYSSPCPL